MSTGPTLLIGMGLGLVIASMIVEVADLAREQGAEQARQEMVLEAGCAAYDTKTGELVWKEITNDEQ